MHANIYMDISQYHLLIEMVTFKCIGKCTC